MEIRAGGANTSHEAGGDRGISGADQAKTSYLKEHFAYRRDLILKKLTVPAVARKMGWSGKVTVSFIICDDGNVEGVKVVESSGFVILI